MSGAEIPAIIGALTSVAGAAYQISEQEAAKSRQDKAAQEELQHQLEYQRKIDDEVAQTVNTLTENQDSQQTVSDYGDQQKNEFMAVVDGLTANQPDAIMGKQTAGKQSDAYLSRIASNKSNEIAKTAELARLLGRVKAPGQNMLDRNLSYTDNQLNMMAPNRNAMRSGALLQNELSLAGQTNDIPGAVLAGVGGAAMSGAFDSYFKPTPNAVLAPAPKAWGGSTAYSPIPASQQKAPLSFIKSKALT